MTIVYYIPICLPNLGTELVELSVLMAGNDELSQRSPHSTGDLVVAAGYRQVGLVVLCRERDGQIHHTHRQEPCSH